MIIQDKEYIQPVILCHAACTGGSLIYRMLVSAFHFVGISEVSHLIRPDPRAYLPLDPVAQLYAQGIISPLEFGEIYYERICQCEKIARASSNGLLIREHSHQYFFSSHKKEFTLASASWINDVYSKVRDEPLFCLVSVRDPIDSWLGLRNSFPNQNISEFDEYCGKYLNFLDMVERTKRVYLFKYEALVHAPQSTLLEIGKNIGLSSLDLDFDVSANVLSSGNSGRKSSEIVMRPRRPFTKRLILSSLNSSNYIELSERLGYALLSENVECQEKRSLLCNCFYNSASFSLWKIAKLFKKISVKFPRIAD